MKNRYQAAIYFISVALIVFCGVLTFKPDTKTVAGVSAKRASGASTQQLSGNVSKQASQSAKPKTKSSDTAVNLASGYCLNVPVLMYHHIEPKEQAKAEGHTALNVDSGIFSSQLAYLSSHGYSTITADQLANALHSHRPLPSKSIVLTFDDGYSDFYSYAYPVLKSHGQIANLMIPTGLIENQGYMTWGQLKEISASGTGEIYNHSWSHASLGAATTDKINYEVSTANKQIQQYIGKNPDIFTYPYGTNGSAVISYLISHGFVAAFSEIPGTYQCDSYVMTLHRTRIGNSALSYYGL